MMIVRQAQIADAESMLAIYKDYVESTVITFEYEVPGIEDFCQRMEKIVEKYPYLVAESDEGILGFSYASAFRPRAPMIGQLKQLFILSAAPVNGASDAYFMIRLRKFV